MNEVHLQIVGTEIEYILTEDNEQEIKARLMAWFPDTLIHIVETDETVQRDVIFN